MNLLEKQKLAREKSEEYGKHSPELLLDWAVQQFSKLALACSFGAEDVVLVDMIHRINPDVDIFYLDTNFLFKETYETRDKLSERYGTQFIQVLPDLTPKEQAIKHGNHLWKTDPHLCCNIRKVQPLEKIVSKYDAWITGIRRDQSPTRASVKMVEYDSRFGLMKLNPLASWTMKDVWNYVKQHNVIYNPLHDQNYPSYSCTYCTRPVKPGEDPRAGRWSGNRKTKCGLHFDIESGNEPK